MSDKFDRFANNIERVKNLNKLFKIVKSTHNRHTVKETDILRASVVFLHSALEDYVRSIIIDKLPLVADKQTLNSISLVGNEGRNEKFYLGELMVHSDLTINQLIQASVREHMSKTSFNNYTDLVSWLRKIHIDISSFQSDKIEKINNMIKRRHKIVHEVYTNPMSGKGHHCAQPIGLPTVNAWIETVENLVKIIDSKYNEIT